jgi:pyruvate,water dikinase
VIRGRFDPDEYRLAATSRKVSTLKGFPVSPGVVTGRARVIINTSSNERVRPGEILVAPFTDPGWALYFMTAAAIVVEMGGVLSHGSIVAREYGIPAVVNVGPATQIIKTGQMLEVDGNQGTVRILGLGP